MTAPDSLPVLILLLAALPVIAVLLLSRLGSAAENRRSPPLLLAVGGLWAISLYLLLADDSLHGKMAFVCLLLPGYLSHRLFFRQAPRPNAESAER